MAAKKEFPKFFLGGGSSGPDLPANPRRKKKLFGGDGRVGVEGESAGEKGLVELRNVSNFGVTADGNEGRQYRKGFQ